MNFRFQDSPVCKRANSGGLCEMDYGVPAPEALWLVECLSKPMAGREGVVDKCVDKATHSLLMLGAAWSATAWGQALATELDGLPRECGPIRIVFVVDVEDDHRMIPYKFLQDDLRRKLRHRPSSRSPTA